MHEIISSGNYTVKETGAIVTYDFEYKSFASIDEAIEELGEVKALSTIQRMVKTDANNPAREKAKSANGHSTRPVMSEAEKAEKKAERKANKELVSVVKGLSEEQIAELPEAVRVALGY